MPMNKIGSKLPFSELQDFIVYMEKKVDPEARLFIDFLYDLMERCYISCSKCDRMIAPDEIYEIENEEPVCEECSKK